jgi:hypothetical protein
LFKNAGKALTRRDPDIPKPQDRKRRSGGTDSRVLLIRRRPHHVAQPAARGHYARLAAVPVAPQQNEFALAGKLLCSIAEDIADMFKDLNRRLAAIINGGPYLSEAATGDLWDALEMMRFHGSDDDIDDGGLDDDYYTQQNSHFPQP